MTKCFTSHYLKLNSSLIKNSEVSEIIHLQANKLACPNFVDAMLEKRTLLLTAQQAPD